MEDVIDLVEEFIATEETDVSNRGLELISNLKSNENENLLTNSKNPV